MQLPEDFTKRMKVLLGEEFEEFLQSYEKERTQAFRINTQKISIESFMKINPFSLRLVPWTEEGFFYDKENRPGKHPYHEAGLYYIQEPSAMGVGMLAAPKPGERVLDLCAAPGGKTTHLAAQMKGEGLLISNEIHPARAKILAQNVERMGITNGIVTNETPKALAERFPEFFDRIVVDAPCSGEGMFRKEEQAFEQWSLDNVAMCASRQQEILELAVSMLRPGGTIVYSTCTFAPEENEGNIERLLREHPEMEIINPKEVPQFSKGRPVWGKDLPELEKTYRLWPHLLEGEGHYIAVLHKEGQTVPAPIRDNVPAIDKKAWESFEEFAKENLRFMPKGTPIMFSDQLYLLPCDLSLKGLKVLRPGLHLGTCKKNRFEPSHALALALTSEQVVRSCSFGSESYEIKGYLKGDTIAYDGDKGWNLVLVDGYSLGWGKGSNGVLKNHYPKGLRK
jgi:NOL1/NOP2/sun family putative RNA methylase